MQSTIHFYGGAGSVTGSNFLLDAGGTKILVDCGLFQGKQVGEESNWAEFAYDPKDISFLINTHAHIDHIGRIPLLVKRGFRGRIISTEATRAIAEPLLHDCMQLTTMDAKKHGHEALYTEEDITQTMRLWEGVSYHQKTELGEGIELELLDAGHILGSAMAQFTREGKHVVFTGDLGGGNSPLLPKTEELKDTNYLVMESVYGDRVRQEQSERRDALEDIIENTFARKGTLLIPAFSTERTQELLYEVRMLMTEKRVPTMPVYIDSPLAEKITDAFLKYPKYFAPDIQKRIEAGENIFTFSELHFVADAEASHKADDVQGPKIVIAGSGMSNGGRIREHEMHVLPDEKSTLLIVGYQVAGSLGRRLSEGASEVEINGQKIKVRCKVEAIYAYSAHMDGEQLVEFANKTAPSLKEVFVVMGEPASSSVLVQRIRDYLGIKATAPEAGENVTIDF